MHTEDTESIEPTPKALQLRIPWTHVYRCVMLALVSIGTWFGSTFSERAREAAKPLIAQHDETLRVSFSNNVQQASLSLSNQVEAVRANLRGEMVSKLDFSETKADVKEIKESLHKVDTRLEVLSERISRKNQ